MRVERPVCLHGALTPVCAKCVAASQVSLMSDNPAVGHAGAALRNPVTEEASLLSPRRSVPARSSGIPGKVLHSALACVFLPSHTTLTFAVLCVAAAHTRSVGRQHRHHHHCHCGRCCGRGQYDNRRVFLLNPSSVASVGAASDSDAAQAV